MIIEAVATGKTVDDAVLAACTQLGRAREDVEIEILDLPKRGFLGLTHIPAKVRAYMEIPDVKEEVSSEIQAEKHTAPKPTAQRFEKKHVEKSTVLKNESPKAPAVKEYVAPKEEDSEERGAEIPMTQNGELALIYAKKIISLMGVEKIEITATQYEKAVVIKVTGDGAGAVIGRRGETLDALQYVTGLAANRSGDDYCRVIIDAGNYRQKRKQTLQQLARRLANNAVKTGRPTTLEPMNPYERRIIHAAVSDIKGAVSTSVGEEPNRCVVISSEGHTGYRPRNSRGRRPYNNNDKERRSSKPRFEKKERSAPYKESSVREVAPTEASDKPLYGKIEL